MFILIHIKMTTNFQMGSNMKIFNHIRKMMLITQLFWKYFVFAAIWHKKNIYLVNENPTIIIIRRLRQHVDSKEGYSCVFTVSWTLGLPIIPGLDNSKKFIQSFHLYRHDTCSACRCDDGRECRGNTIWLCRYACLCFEADLGLSWRWWL